MKKHGIILMAMFLIAACNSNKDKEATPTNETESASGNGNQATNEEVVTLSGKFEIVDYKKNDVQIVLPNKVTVEFTKDGNVIKSDGDSFLYKIEGDSISFLTPANVVVRKSKLEFLNTDKTSFVVKTPLDKSETTYQKIN